METLVREEKLASGGEPRPNSFLATHPFLEIEAYGNRVTVSSPSGASASGSGATV